MVFRGRSRVVAIGKVALALVLSLAFFAAVDAVSAVTSHPVPAVALAASCVGATVLVARRWGVAYAVPIVIASLVGFDWFYIPPTHDSDFPGAPNALAIGAYLVVGVLIGQLAARAWRSADISEVARSVLASEQASLRRVATLVAHGVSQDELFAAVAREAGMLPGVHLVGIGRFHTPESITVVAACGDPLLRDPAGRSWRLDPDAPVAATILRTGRPVRFDLAAGQTYQGPILGGLNVRSGVGCPIVVEGRPWGLMFATSPTVLPADTEERLTNFTELVATAIANAEARVEVSRLAEEQAALRRIATLVARGVPPSEILAAVAEELAHIFDADSGGIARYEADSTLTALASWSTGSTPWPEGSNWSLEGDSIVRRVYDTGRPAHMRAQEYDAAAGNLAALGRETGLRSSVGAPIVVDDRLWGVAAVSSAGIDPFPSDTDARMADFTELVATAISNAETRAELTASRARVVAAADAARQRLERDLHDGIQQRLVALSLELRGVEELAPHSLSRDLTRIGEGLTEAVDELREIARGIHPAILTEGGLVPALKTLARRSPISVSLQVRVQARLPERVEVAAYYVASEALANTQKHAAATEVEMRVEAVNGTLDLSIRDDGVGGADPGRGSGLIGLGDRVAAMGGSMSVASPKGAGTILRVSLPV